MEGGNDYGKKERQKKEEKVNPPANIGKKASVTFYLVFLYLAIFIVIITAVFAPLGTDFGTEFYSAGDLIMNKSHDRLSSISDPTIRNEINETLNQAQANQQLNIEVNASLYKYSWLVLLGLSALGLFLFTRRLNEVRGIS